MFRLAESALLREEWGEDKAEVFQTPLIPAQAGNWCGVSRTWWPEVPAFAGMSEVQLCTNVANKVSTCKPRDTPDFPHTISSGISPSHVEYPRHRPV